jgi:hypothetical protein
VTPCFLPVEYGWLEKEKDCLCSWIKTYCTRILIVSPLVYIAPYILLFPSHTTVDIEAEKKTFKI